jgi:MFS transporter, PPP family, 3-phenylpropionic acid transporter
MPRSLTVTLALYYVASFAALGFYLPYMPAWLEARGFVGPTMSALAMLLPAMAIVMPPVIGMIADAFALRSGLLRIACGGAALAFGTLAVASRQLSPLPFAVAFVCFLVFAAFRAAMSGLADVIALEHARHYGRLRLWGSAGFLASAGLGGHFIDPKDPVTVPACVAVGMAVSFLLAQRLPRSSTIPPRPAPAEARRLLGNPSFRWLLVVILLGIGAHSAYDLCVTLRLRALGASGSFIGTCWAVATAAEIVLMASIAPSLQRLGPARLLVVGIGAGALRWSLLATVTSLPLLLLLQPLHALSFGLTWVSALAVLKEQTGGTGLATAQGLFSASMATGATLGMAMWGNLYARGGGEAVFSTAALIACAATAAALLLLRSLRALAPRAAYSDLPLP